MQPLSHTHIGFPQHVSLRGALPDNHSRGAHDNCNDWSSWLCKSRKELRKKKKEEERGKRGVDCSRSEQCPGFCFEQGDGLCISKGTGWGIGGRNRCSYTMDMHFGRLLTLWSSREWIPPLWGNKEKYRIITPVDDISRKCCWGIRLLPFTTDGCLDNVKCNNVQHNNLRNRFICHVCIKKHSEADSFSLVSWKRISKWKTIARSINVT